jgi:hypothetical protein
MLWVKRFRSIEHYRGSNANPNSNASVLTNGDTVVQVPVVGVIVRETLGERFRESSAPLVFRDRAPGTRVAPWKPI